MCYGGVNKNHTILRVVKSRFRNSSVLWLSCYLIGYFYPLVRTLLGILYHPRPAGSLACRPMLVFWARAPPTVRLLEQMPLSAGVRGESNILPEPLSHGKSVSAVRFDVSGRWWEHGAASFGKGLLCPIEWFRVLTSQTLCGKTRAQNPRLSGLPERADFWLFSAPTSKFIAIELISVEAQQMWLKIYLFRLQTKVTRASSFFLEHHHDWAIHWDDYNSEVIWLTLLIWS